MQCVRCRRPAVIFQPYSGNSFCNYHFTMDFERRLKKAIRIQGGIRSEDRVAVALSGGPSSSALILVLSKILPGRRSKSMVALTIDDGRPDRIKFARKIASDLSVEWVCDGTIDQKIPGQNSFDLALRLDHLTREAKATKLAVGYTLEEHAYGIFSALSSGITKPQRTDDITQKTRHPIFSILRPILAIPKGEAQLYAEIELGFPFDNYPEELCTAHADKTHQIFSEFCRKHPSTPFALIKLGENLGLGTDFLGMPQSGFYGECLGIQQFKRTHAN